MNHTCRSFGKLALASFPIASVALSHPRVAFGAEKPNSKFNGVPVGVIAPYSYHFMPNDATSLLRFIVMDNINAIEMQGPPVEEWAGAPANPHGSGGGQMPVGAPVRV